MHLQHSKRQGEGINYTSTPNPIKKIKCTLHILIKSSFEVTGDTSEYDILIGYAGYHQSLQASLKMLRPLHQLKERHTEPGVRRKGQNLLHFMSGTIDRTVINVREGGKL